MTVGWTIDGGSTHMTYVFFIHDMSCNVYPWEHEVLLCCALCVVKKVLTFMYVKCIKYPGTWKHDKKNIFKCIIMHTMHTCTCSSNKFTTVNLP